MYFIINLSGSQQFSGSSIQNQVELSEWATGRFMHCVGVKLPRVLSRPAARQHPKEFDTNDTHNHV